MSIHYYMALYMKNIDFKNKRVFISGGAGVIGTYVVEKLIKQKAIIFVGDLKPCPPEWRSRLQYRQGDLNYVSRSEIEEFQPEYFVHLAATFERSEETYDFWKENFHHNLNLSHRLMTIFKDLKSLKRVVFASSYLIYDKDNYLSNKPKNTPFNLDENTSINPRNLTGMAKLATEIELDFLNQFKSKHYSSISARIYRSYGKNSRDVVSRWIRLLIKGEKIELYSKESMFDYIYAGDVAEGLIRLLNNKEKGIVNLGTGRSRKVEDILHILEIYFPRLKYKEILLTNNKYEASQADMKKYKQITGWYPKINLEKAIPKIIDFEKNKQKNKLIQNQNNILISSVSSKVPLIKCVIEAARKVDQNIKIYGGDSKTNIIGKYFVDTFWKMPNLKNLSVNRLLEYCLKNSIKIIIPTRDGELEYYSRHKRILAKNGINVMVSDINSVKLSLDKLKFYTNLANKNVQITPTSLSINEINAKSYVVKERYGAGSKMIGLNLDKQSAINHAELLINPIYQPFTKGIESSVDAYITQQGTIKGMVARIRELVVDGEAQITSTFIDRKLENVITKLIKSMKLTGHVIIQVIKDDHGKYNIIECNARFGGASTLSVASGLDPFYWFILESMGQNIENYPFYRVRNNIRQIRYKSDKIESV